ncbi:MAG: glutamine-hydrolyzing carbamoyl-phosphate synthase small subunit [Myxococcales bacterium]|nr:glutamine-hydrolyzing carbamoyl-phosphate synthase small subunit [Myxococcales bacterium]MCB9737150.1 glutamine-hydrolyzing carbamoyl-phosphate synthase small subunit [Deltaproteobacteria bacterium]
MTTPGLLALADGTLYRGVSVGASGYAVGEVVFNTAMTGYQEVLSDPSYHQQIVTLTVSHVGNTGANPDDDEAAAPQCAGLIVRDVPRRTSSWRATESLPDYLARSGVVALAEIDTRALTRRLRDHGSQDGCLVAGDALSPEEAVAAARAFGGLAGADLAKVVSIVQRTTWRDGSVRWLGEVHAATHTRPEPGRHVVAYDFGVKRNILRMLVDRGCRVTVVPAETPASEVMALAPDGVFLSNGPGDPEPVTYAQEAIRAFVAAGLPVFGICLGHQLLCLALGARSLKMKFGHHGANHPVRDHDTGQVLITSQNHGFAIDAATLPEALRVTHTSLFDGSLQGVAHATLPVRSFQGHPEASPGPHEVGYLFDRFVHDMDQRAAAGAAHA